MSGEGCLFDEDRSDKHDVVGGVGAELELKSSAAGRLKTVPLS